MPGAAPAWSCTLTGEGACCSRARPQDPAPLQGLGHRLPEGGGEELHLAYLIHHHQPFLLYRFPEGFHPHPFQGGHIHPIFAHAEGTGEVHMGQDRRCPLLGHQAEALPYPLGPDFLRIEAPRPAGVRGQGLLDEGCLARAGAPRQEAGGPVRSYPFCPAFFLSTYFFALRRCLRSATLFLLFISSSGLLLSCKSSRHTAVSRDPSLRSG